MTTFKRQTFSFDESFKCLLVEYEFMGKPLFWTDLIGMKKLAAVTISNRSFPVTTQQVLK